MKRQLKNGVLWDDERGIGHMPGDGRRIYDAAYFEKYVGYARTPLGSALNAARLDFVARHYSSSLPLVDIGIGCGQFVESRKNTFGYDVNPSAIRWLIDRGCWWDPWAYRPEAVSMWDSLEHMDDPAGFLARVNRYVFVSLPIFDGPDHVLRSKHFRPDEHLWYFTYLGLVRFMQIQGFHLIDESDMETKLGREDIHTFTFRRATT